MEPIYRQQFTIDHLHLDRFGRCKPSALLYFAQEAAENHCLILAADWRTLQEKGLFWAVIRQKVQVTRLPAAGEVITVETWPMPTTRVAFPRSTVAYDQQGNEVFRAISLWVLMDVESRAMVLPGKSGITVEGTLRGTELSAPGRPVPAVLEKRQSRAVRFSELDRNGHMNNTRYLDWLADLLPSGFHLEHPAREFTVCYMSEAREGEELDLSWELGEGPVLTVEAHRAQTDVPQQKQVVFTAQMRF